MGLQKDRSNCPGSSIPLTIKKRIPEQVALECVGLGCVGLVTRRMMVRVNGLNKGQRVRTKSNRIPRPLIR